MIRILLVLAVVLGCLAHCIPQDPNLECAQCPCPAGYRCAQGGYCLRTETKGTVEEICGIKIDASEPLKESRPEPLPENKPEPVPEPRPEPKPEPTPEVTADEGKPGALQLSAPTRLKLGASCPTIRSIHANKVCEPGLRCTQLSGTKASCLQDCSTDPTVCTKNQDGRKHCRQVGWDPSDRPVSVCLRLAGKGETCNMALSTGCDQSNAYLICLKGTCVEATEETKTGNPCGLVQGKQVVCSISEQLACDTGGKCVKGNQALLGMKCDTKNVCQPGQVCKLSTIREKIDASKRCYEACKTANDCSLSNPICREGLCIQTKCEVTSDCQQLDGFSCVLVNHNGNPQTKACLPVKQEGVGLGEACIEGCGLGLHCLSLQPYPKQCTTLCRRDADCTIIGKNIKADTSRGKCLKVPGGLSYCAWGCLVPADCPYTNAVCKFRYTGGLYCTRPQ